MLRFLRRALSRLRPERRTHGLDPEDFVRITGEPVERFELYVQAMKHRSVLRDAVDGDADSNERLEFLGDAVLGLATAEYLYLRYPDEDEGYLTRLRAKLVNARALASRAEALGLGDLVMLSDNMKQARGGSNTNILSDAMEALIGAVYLDQGADAARRFVSSRLLEPLDIDSLAQREDNHKSLLLEYAQERGWPQPRYEVVSEEGPGHDRRFTVQVVIHDDPVGEGTGKSKKLAGQRAAAAALRHFRSDA
jgi:ribonuclease-3